MSVTCFALLTLTAEAKSVLNKEWNFVQVNKLPDNWMISPPAGSKTFCLNSKNFIDLDRVAGRYGKLGDIGIVYQKFELDSDREILFGIGADWWFDVYLNGKLICSSGEKGNSSGSFSVNNQIFSAKAVKGTNTLAISLKRGKYTWLFCFADLTTSSISPVSPVTVTVDKNRPVGKIKMMNAVNNGPVGGSGWNPKGPGNIAAWKALEIPYGRTHDSSAFYPYGGEFTVDVHRIFTDFSKDPYDPASYDFVSTDHFLKMIEAGNTKVFYRLGATIEHTIKKFGTRVPADAKKWAVICEHIIRHYTEGWANGFHMDIKYWEIWNEPDIKKNPSPTWQGTPEQFFHLYRTTALHLKKCFPKLKIGGPAIAGDLEWARNFFKYMTTGERVPLDFFSWHIYCKNPSDIAVKAEQIRGMLDEFGYHQTESILNEWNYVRRWTNTPHASRVIKSIKGAAFTASAMITGQNSPIDMMMYYDARPCTWNGLFESGTYRLKKGYYVFLIWAKLRKLGQQIAVETGDKCGLSALAATDGKKVGIMLSRYFEQDDLPGVLRVTIRVPGVDLRGVKVMLIDDRNDFTDIPYRMTADGDLIVDMNAHSVIYIEK